MTGRHMASTPGCPYWSIVMFPVSLPWGEFEMWPRPIRAGLAVTVTDHPIHKGRRGFVRWSLDRDLHGWWEVALDDGEIAPFLASELRPTHPVTR